MTARFFFSFICMSRRWACSSAAPRKAAEPAAGTAVEAAGTAAAAAAQPAACRMRCKNTHRQRSAFRNLGKT